MVRFDYIDVHRVFVYAWDWNRFLCIFCFLVEIIDLQDYSLLQFLFPFFKRSPFFNLEILTIITLVFYQSSGHIANKSNHGPGQFNKNKLPVNNIIVRKLRLLFSV